MVEHAAVNRVVVGSSPTSGANFQTVDVQRFSTGKTGKKDPEGVKWVVKWAVTALGGDHSCTASTNSLTTP